ncbi:MAG: hypothetical protein F6K58_04950 [Symploca sp. SIO2E9]|nr:hypothetical protein [Symploca sp. SIO2E9]
MSTGFPIYSKEIVSQINYAGYSLSLKWSRETQAFAERIASREPTLNPELLETLYTVLALSDQVAEALLALEQVQTPTYCNLTKKHLRDSYDRLQLYADLHRQHQQRRLQLKSVILLSDFGEELLSTPPTPEELQNLGTYGRSNLLRQTRLKQDYPQAQMLKCP